MQLSSKGQPLRLEAARLKLSRERQRSFDVPPRPIRQVAQRVPTGIGGVLRDDLGAPVSDPHRRFNRGKRLAQCAGCAVGEPEGEGQHRPIGHFDTTEPVLA